MKVAKFTEIATPGFDSLHSKTDLSGQTLEARPVDVPVEAELVYQGLIVVQQVARRLARRLGGCVPLDDLVGIGNLALLELARAYDPSRSSFPTYVSAKVRWLILDGVRRETHGRVAAARASALSAAERFVSADRSETDPTGATSHEDDQTALGTFLAGHAAVLALGLVTAGTAAEATNPEEQVGRAELGAQLRFAVRKLPEPKRSLVERHYFGGERFDAIARALGISKSWASRLHAEAMEDLGVAARELIGWAPRGPRRS